MTRNTEGFPSFVWTYRRIYSNQPSVQYDRGAVHSNHGVVCKTFDEAEIYNRNLKSRFNVNKPFRSGATAMKLQKIITKKY